MNPTSFYPRSGRVYPYNPRNMRSMRQPSFNVTPQNMPNPMMSNSPYPTSLMRSSIPLSIPKGGLLKSLIPASGASAKGTLSKVLASTESVIATVNQVIPIYQQVKPLWDNSKGLRTAIKKILPFKSRSSSQTRASEVIEDPEVITPKNETKETKKDEYVEENEPGKPFF